LKSLQVLDLSETAIGDAGLAKLGPLTGLRALHLAGSQVTEAGVQAFIQAHPQCKVFWK
jgi:hypothetical protein